ncbi:NFACT RNA binding domain-containing protein [Synechococcus sp. RSCCF101]|uniref:NFACT RNA binding domain-containing protein n=1 Tax=Synechococcus sp. RSCCF101 TaxID=2511069 RepID=UPI00351A3018
MANETFEHWRDLLTLVPEPLGKALRNTYRGISPALARQLAEEASGDPGAPGSDAAADTPLPLRLTGEVAEAEWAGLWQAWQRWLGALENGHFQFRGTEDGGYRCWGRCPPDGPSGGERRSAPINDALATYYRSRLGERRLLERTRQLSQWLSRAEEREQAALNDQRRRLEAATEAQSLREEADRILCRANPSREELDQAQAFYHRSRRLRRSLESVPARIEHHRLRLESIQASQTYLEAIETDPSAPEAALQQLEELRLDCSDWVDAAAGRASRRRSRPAASAVPRPLELRSPSGLRLLVGRNHRQNDWISLRQARRGDLWFHAQECPGSHVVLKSSESAAQPADIQLAADVAAFCSRARGSRHVSVQMVPADQLQRIPGTAPGTVRHRGAEVIWADPARACGVVQEASSEASGSP